jgi:PEP-CTERM motif
MKHFFMRLLFTLAVAAVGHSAARAELIDFSYQWAANPTTVSSGTGLVSITPQPKGTSQFDTVAGGAAFIPSVSITTTSSALDSAPDVYPGAGGGKFGLALTLTDAASGHTGTLTFSGSVSGQLSSQTINTLTATFDTPLTQTLTLGSHVYSVAVDSFASLPKPGATANVFLSAGVSVTGSNGTPPPPPPPPPPTENTPEPSSLVLGGVALVGFAARRWTRKRGPAV